MWNLDDILVALSGALKAEHDRLTDEQAVHNIDALDEVSIHPLLAGALAGAGYGVLREVMYPGEWIAKPGRRRKPLPDDSQRQRCDLVLTPAPGQELVDPLASRRAEDKDEHDRAGTLFAAADVAPLPPVIAPGTGVAPDEACWLEVKVVGQFCPVAGVPGPNPAFASQLLRGPTDDLRKLAADPAILHAAAVVVLFAHSEEVARHDLGVLVRRCLDKGLIAEAPRVMGCPILDRIGNGAAMVAMLRPARA